MTKIPIDEVLFNPTSYVDPNGRIFEWRGEILRAITSQATPFYQELLDKGLVQELHDKGLLVKTEITPFSLGNYGLVLKHYKIPFLTYCFEWPAPMLKAAALLTLDLNIRLVEADLILQDAYPWNVYFDSTRPVFVDLGSIVQVDPDFIWVAYHQFCKFFLYPLHIHSSGRGKISRLLLTHYWEGVLDEDILHMTPFLYKLKKIGIMTRVVLPSVLERIINKITPQSKKLKKKEWKLGKFNTPNIRLRFLKSLRKEVESIKIDMRKKKRSSFSQERFFPFEDAPEDFSQKQKVVSEILDKLSPRTVLDLGCNTGRYSILAAEKGARVLSCDQDDISISQLYYEAKEKDLYIIPLVMDLINPSPSFGWCCKQFPSAIKRLKCEMVFCLMLIRYLVFKQWQNFDRITETLNAFSEKWALLEYVPREDEYIQDCWHERFEWYTLENLIKSLEGSFNKVKVFDSYPEGRKLLLCEK